MASDYFSIQQSIADRLAGQVASLRSVRTGNAQMSTGDSMAKPACVVYHDSAQPWGRGNGQTLLRHQWVVALTLGMANDPSGARARADAGPILAMIIAALSGWSPGADISSIELVAGRKEQYTKSLATFTLQFTSLTVIQ